MFDVLNNVAGLWVLGLFLGMRHATDADHVVAIATIVSRQPSLRGSALIGAAWGVGHTLTILAVGSAMILFGLVIPPRMGLAMEFAVGVMLIVLGILTLTGVGNVLRAAAGHSHTHDHGHPHRHAHAHGDYVHRHTHAGDAAHGHAEDATPLARLDARFRDVWLYQLARPLVVGLVHGLAGSAAVALLVLTVVHDPVWAVTYLLLFGLGTVAGMMLITVALSVPFALTSGRLPRFNFQMRTASGLISFGFGLFLVYQIGFVDGGLFSANPAWTPQ
jgi:high-affinity nickel-transport protein